MKGGPTKTMEGPLSHRGVLSCLGGAPVAWTGRSEASRGRSSTFAAAFAAVARSNGVISEDRVT
jgi:hypothetical protein